MNNVHLVHRRTSLELTFDILLSTPTFHILAAEPPVPGGLGQAWSAGCSGNTGLPQDKRSSKHRVLVLLIW